jgi:hypothetical protein
MTCSSARRAWWCGGRSAGFERGPGQGPRASCDPVDLCLRSEGADSRGGCRLPIWPVVLLPDFGGGVAGQCLRNGGSRFPQFTGAQSWDAGAAALEGGSFVGWRASQKLWCWLVATVVRTAWFRRAVCGDGGTGVALATVRSSCRWR